MSRGRSIDALGAWIRVVAFNVARDRHRRRGAEHSRLERLAQGSIESSRDLGADVALAVDVEAALRLLNRQQREIVVMFYFLDDSVESIAADLGIPAGTVKSALHRARAELAELLGSEMHRKGRVGHA